MEAYAATVRSLTVVTAALNGEIATMERQVTTCFRGHPDAAIYLSQPGTADILGARVLGESGDDPHRYATAKARKNDAATSPITRQSGKKKTVLARYVRNGRLAGALHRQARSALIASPGARACYDEQRGRGLDHDAALRALSNRLAWILHGCLKTGTLRRGNRLVTPRDTSRGRLTIKIQGCLCQPSRPDGEGQAGACPDRTRAIPCKVRAVTGRFRGAAGCRGQSQPGAIPGATGAGNLRRLRTDVNNGQRHAEGHGLT